MYKIGFRKGRGTRDQIANIHWIVEKAKGFQKNICFTDYAITFDCVDHNKLENSSRVTLENLLDCKEMKPFNSKGNQSCIFIGKTDAEAETPILCAPDGKN